MRIRFSSSLLALISFAVFIVSPTISYAAYNWVTNPSNGHEYKVIEFCQWEDCEDAAQIAGGHLVTVNDAYEQAWLYTTFQTQLGYCNSYNSRYDCGLWIGMTDKATEGVWKWASGQTSTYTYWDSYQPDNSYSTTCGEDFVFMSVEDSYVGKWSDYGPCSSSWSVVDKGIIEKQPPPPVRKLTLTRTGTGSGSVTDNLSKINCPSDCTDDYTDGTFVKLKATPYPDSKFVSWSGACTGTSATCTVLMNSDKAVTATFSLSYTHENTNGSVSYSPSCWNLYNNSKLSGGSAHMTSIANCTASLSFNGSKVEWISAKHKQLGKAKTYIDNVYQSTVDLYGSLTSVKRVVYSKSFGSTGAHSIKIEATGTKNPSATGTNVLVDAFNVVP